MLGYNYINRGVHMVKLWVGLEFSVRVRVRARAKLGLG